MKTLILLLSVLGLGSIGCNHDIVAIPPPSEECDCDEVDLDDVCAEECAEPLPETNEGASCERESDCTEGLWCVITPETGATVGVCHQVG